MENTTQPLDRPNDVNLNISRPAAHYLQETSKWTHFLSIIGFIVTGLIVIVALFAGAIISQIPQYENMPGGFGVMASIFYLLFALLYFFPTMYLYKFTQKLKLALASGSSDDLVAAFENQKSLYKFWGIFTIVILSIYAVIFVFAFGFSQLFS